MNRFENYSKPRVWLMVLAVAAFVAGCGGGGDGGSSGGSSGGGGGGGGGTGAGAVCSGVGCVSLGAAGDLGAAGGYAILAKTGISTIPNSVVTGNVGLSPTARVGLTDWSETAAADNSDLYSTSAQVVAPFKLYAADYAQPTPTNLGTAVLSMEAAYTAANGMAPAGGGDPAAGGVACPGVGILDGLTITPGVYTCTVNLSIGTGTNVTLSGAGVYVIRTTQGISQASGTQVLLTNGALAQNVFWVPALTVNIVGTAGTTTRMAGVILAKTDIVVGTNATVNGRLLAQTAVTLDQATITQP